MKLDSLDLEIISILEKNGRTSNKEIAKKVKTSEGTVRNRINKLIESKYFMVKGLINPNIDREKQLIYLGIKVTLTRSANHIAQDIRDIPNTRSLSLVTGRYDIIAEVFIEPWELLKHHQKLAKIEGVVSVESFIALENLDKWI